MQLDVQWFIYALADNNIVSAEDAVRFNDDLGGDPTLETFSQELLAALTKDLTVEQKAEINMQFQKITRFAISQASTGVSPSIFEVVEEPIEPAPAPLAGFAPVAEAVAPLLDRLAETTVPGGLALVAEPDGIRAASVMNRLLGRIDALRPGHIVAGIAAEALPTAGLHSRLTVMDPRCESGGVIFDRARREHADILLFEELPGQDALAPLLECAAGGTVVLLGMRAAGKFGTLRTLLRAAPQPQRHWSRLLLAESLRGIASASQVTFRDDALVNAIVENRLDDGARQDG